MRLIYQLLDNFLILFKKNKKKVEPLKIESTKPELIGSLGFDILNTDEIDILYGIPLNLKDKDHAEIATMAEQFASFIVGLTSGSLNEAIYKSLHNKLNTNGDPNHLLFIDNVLIFWSILYKEKIKKKQKKSDQYQPVIKPSEVFRP